MLKKWFLLLIFILLWGSLALAKEPVSIKADHMEVLEKENKVIFTGHVVAQKKDFTIYADKLVVFYHLVNGKREVKKIEATGKVKIKRGELIASAQKATYFRDKDILVLEGSPEVWQGDNTVRGSRIVIYLSEDRYVAESAPSERAEAILFVD
ncbi:lipopolysaccharide transport periplasmic protein LptA [Thermodesulfatator indicus DSM 15286]|uniref:Lipopolysaccharide transport periplasmic protein LptA n=1 Tax=Thermodesulfatator indicus (strain DSM 15286 / JCM 11887 / CIR29812) TaxID=667014 RepID=F8A9N5_THEID|nr:lipopolysaccharide transport periplasmic protein LptA [Thermodesulfatator indicus]AEH45266.1 lipopolysaccharide transport periplasmic protein LptA [Thermodesulfatator indicus DSM 15286]